ncbi:MULTISPECIES: hypothetical protein [Pectobacterium]
MQITALIQPHQTIKQGWEIFSKSSYQPAFKAVPHFLNTVLEKENSMTVFLMAVAYGIFKTGGFILLVVKGYQGWTWFFKNYDDLPHIYRSRWRYQRRFIFRRIWKRIFNH